MNNVISKLVGLGLLFAANVTIGMQDIPTLPSDVQKIIANKALRVILDETESYPNLLMEPQWKSKSYLLGGIINYSLYEEKAPLIDMIIKLVVNGANPNTKNYKGHTILDLLIAGMPQSDLRGDLYYRKYADPVLVKIGLLSKYKINLNAQDDEGNTLAHKIIDEKVDDKPVFVLDQLFYPKPEKGLQDRWKYVREFFSALKNLGLDFTIKNKDGKIPSETEPRDPYWSIFVREVASKFI